MSSYKLLIIINVTLAAVLCAVVAKTLMKVPVSLEAADIKIETSAQQMGQKDVLEVERDNHWPKQYIDQKLFFNERSSGTDEIITKQIITDKEQPKLNLILLGTSTGSVNLARAVITDLEADHTGVYKIGDIVAGAEIVDITRDSVILQTGDQRLCLKTYGKESSGDINLLPGENNIPTNNRGLIKNAAQVSADMIENLLETVEIKPYVMDNKPDGLQLNKLERNNLARLVGLKNGDVIRLVNGQKLSSKQKAFQVFKKARTQPKLEIEIIRDNKSNILVFGSN